MLSPLRCVHGEAGAPHAKRLRAVINAIAAPPCATYQVRSDGALRQHEGAFRYQEDLDVGEAR